VLERGVPTRSQKRWSARLRTAGALLSLAGVVALGDRLLPAAPDPVLGPPGGARSLVLVAAALGLVAVGAALLWIGRRWR
jgi:hypothetical protein